MRQDNPLGRYTLLRELGRGAIGTLSAARDRSTGATVALRILNPELLGAGDAKLAGLFLKNARSAARLKHPNIVKVHEAGEGGGTAFVAMELVEGESLRRLLDGRPLPIARAVRIFDDIASALAYAHEEGMVHRGVRPSSIFVLRSGAAAIGDFGIGQIGEAALPYLSPEQVRGNTAAHRVDPRSDLFSLGAVFYEMLTGRAPFAGGSANEIKERILGAKPPPPSQVNPHVPAALDALVAGLLARNPDERFASARIVLRELQRFEEALGLRPGASAVAAQPKPSAPPMPPEPELRIPEPQLRAPDPNRFRDPAPMHPAPEPTWREPGRDAGGPRFHDPRPAKYRAREPEPRSGSRTAVLATLALLLAVLSIGLTVFLNYSPGLGDRLLASVDRQAPASSAAPIASIAPRPSITPSPSITSSANTPSPSTLPSGSAMPSSSTAPPLATQAIEQTSVAPPAPPLPPANDAVPEESPPVASAPVPSPSKPLVEAKLPPAQPKTSPPPELEQTASASTAPSQEAPKAATKAGTEAATKAGTAAATAAATRAAKPTVTAPEPQPAGTAKLTIAVAPRGEIYIDGEHKGTTPPITTLDLAPGLHRVEIRHGSGRPYLTYMTLQAGDQRRIRYDFNARRHPPA